MTVRKKTIEILSREYTPSPDYHGLLIQFKAMAKLLQNKEEMLAVGYTTEQWLNATRITELEQQVDSERAMNALLTAENTILAEEAEAFPLPRGDLQEICIEAEKTIKEFAKDKNLRTFNVYFSRGKWCVDFSWQVNFFTHRIESSGDGIIKVLCNLAETIRERK